MTTPSALGHILEGVVELNPITDHPQITTVDDNGKAQSIDLHELLAQYVGKEVRFTLASFEGLAELAKMVASAQGGDQVFGVTPEQLPAVPFNIVRK